MSKFDLYVSLEVIILSLDFNLAKCFNRVAFECNCSLYGLLFSIVTHRLVLGAVMTRITIFFWKSR